MRAEHAIQRSCAALLSIAQRYYDWQRQRIWPNLVCGRY